MADELSKTLLDQQLSTAALLGNMPRVAGLLAEGADPLADNSMALRFASMNGYLECVELLLPLSGAGSSSMAAIMAAFCGRAECLAAIIAFSQEPINVDEALSGAAKNGHAECIHVLLPLLAGPPDSAVMSAARAGHAGALDMLVNANLGAAKFSGILPLARDAAMENDRWECSRILGALIEAGELGLSTGGALLDPKPPTRL